MVSTKSRLIRAMKGCSRVRFYDENSMPNSYFAKYENSGDQILISEDEIFYTKEQSKVRFSDIESATCLVDDNVLLDEIQIKMKNGEKIRLPISGHEGRQYDAHLFVRFLTRTLEDKAGSIKPQVQQG